RLGDRQVDLGVAGQIQRERRGSQEHEQGGDDCQPPARCKRLIHGGSDARGAFGGQWSPQLSGGIAPPRGAAISPPGWAIPPWRAISRTSASASASKAWSSAGRSP